MYSSNSKLKAQNEIQVSRYFEQIKTCFCMPAKKAEERILGSKQPNRNYFKL